uniref:Nucleocapsid n=1 Tax=Leptomonas pyrrhocoris leishbunyavirus 2 TaxID=3070840 RepID=A0AA50KIJ4_9VIRU|nr:nucleocapsid [Leptomonas pyrrhocoris leishbunyavirus 2]WMB96334.1 nucleocapsid [Leptomonas pyrrhocoris leishbunyavirus 2]WMB96342.1 nucleocapsid [Leptomonas pyrrhocoris leishbunyavirus 2]
MAFVDLSAVVSILGFSLADIEYDVCSSYSVRMEIEALGKSAVGKVCSAAAVVALRGTNESRIVSKSKVRASGEMAARILRDAQAVLPKYKLGKLCSAFPEILVQLCPREVARTQLARASGIPFSEFHRANMEFLELRGIPTEKFEKIAKDLYETSEWDGVVAALRAARKKASAPAAS